ncbi:subtilase family protein [Kribbella rubisoli]|uniref:Subtilase family protein n=1 Tax=Kribbella rubisoli TaxID=3075929 RepID=A0A4Q7WZS7_9ACTN|nr:S8/S53 family peptidase [Kribbella rubisoli]RZU15798.1 subtilase family protein [Kribbella rubisoli]
MSEQQRLEEAVDLILEHDPRAAVYPPSWRADGRVQYFYRRNTILVRTRDLELVETTLRQDPSDEYVRRHEGHTAGPILPEGIRIEKLPVIAGVTRIDWSDDVGEPYDTLSVLEGLDDQLGLNTATPVHGLSVCPNSGHPCPANDPAAVPSKSCGPVPPVNDGICCGTHGWDGDGVVVGVVDGGLIEDAPKTWPWMEGVYGDFEDPYDANHIIKPYAGHGTFVAGCVRCVAPRAEVYVRRAEEIAGLAYEDEIIQKMSDTLNQGADIIVCEFDGITRLHLPMLTFSAFYDECLRHVNVVVVAPAGNDTSRLPTYPAAYSWVVGVGALSANGTYRADFSNWGGWVDVYAPGVDLVNALAVGDYDTVHDPKERRHLDGLVKWSGTSFSAPLVAGMIAARMSATGENAPQAAEALLRFALSQAVRGVGPVLLPDQVCGTPREACHHGCDCACK